MDKFVRLTKELERYLGETYSNSCQQDIIIKTPDTFTDPDISTTISDMVVDHPKMDTEMTYLKNKTIDKAIRQKLRNKDAYKIDMHKIYNLILGQTKNLLQEKAAPDATFQAVNIG